MVEFIIAEEFGKAFVPKRFRTKIRQFFMKAGFNEVPYGFFGLLFYVSVIITALVYIFGIYPILREQESGNVVFLVITMLFWAGIQLSLSLFAMVSIYVYLDVRIYNRTKKLELVLQEFLRYVSENLRGGMSFEKSMWDAIRPKFGVLADEIKLAAKKVTTGQDVEEALNEFTDKYDSPMLKRSFNLIVEGMKGGANIADLIERIEKNLRETKELKDEIVVTNTTFVIFLTVIALIITPALFGLSYNLLLILKNIAAKLGSATSGGNVNVPLNLNEISIDPQAFITFSQYALMISAGFTSMIISIIRKGNIREGLHFIPVYVVISLVMYAIFRSILSLLFAGIAI